MRMQTLAVLGVVFVIALGAWYWTYTRVRAPSGPESVTFLVEGAKVTLVNGRAETPAAPGSAATVVTQYFGNAAAGDLNGDSIPDAAFIITQSKGGSGTFYYVVAAIQTKDGYEGTNAVYLGDRIAPQTTEIQDGKLLVNYAERKPGEPMTTPPSVGKTLRLFLNPLLMQLGIVPSGA